MTQCSLNKKYHQRDIVVDTKLGRTTTPEKTYMRPLPVTLIPENINEMWLLINLNPSMKRNMQPPEWRIK